MKKTALAFVIFSLVFTVAQGKSIWVEKNPYSSSGNLQAGDVILIHVRDISNLRFSMTSDNTSSSDVSSEPDTTITGFLPKANSRKKVNHNEGTSLSGKGNLDFTMAARVLNRAGNNLAIGGTKSYTINGTTTIISINGIISPESLQGMSVSSLYLADMTLEVRTVKRGFNLNRPAPQGDDKAKTDLTEAEKQRIIVDYLNRILSELSQ